LTLQATLEENPNPIAKIKLKGKSLPKQGGFFGECDPFFRIKRLSKSYGDVITVYESDVFRNEKNPEFKKIVISTNRLCDGNRFEEITFEVFDHAKRSDHLRVGEVKTT